MSTIGICDLKKHYKPMLIYRFCKYLLASMFFEESQLCK